MAFTWFELSQPAGQILFNNSFKMFLIWRGRTWRWFMLLVFVTFVMSSLYICISNDILLLCPWTYSNMILLNENILTILEDCRFALSWLATCWLFFQSWPFLHSFANRFFLADWGYFWAQVTRTRKFWELSTIRRALSCALICRFSTHSTEPKVRDVPPYLVSQVCFWNFYFRQLN